MTEAARSPARLTPPGNVVREDGRRMQVPHRVAHAVLGRNCRQSGVVSRRQTVQHPTRRDVVDLEEIASSSARAGRWPRYRVDCGLQSSGRERRADAHEQTEWPQPRRPPDHPIEPQLENHGIPKIHCTNPTFHATLTTILVCAAGSDTGNTLIRDLNGTIEPACVQYI